jgi:hypothetical protein
MEAVAYGQHANRFKNELRIGEVYLIRGLGFQPADMPPQLGLAIPSDYYIIMHSRTQIRPAGPSISIPCLPSRFMDFIHIAGLRNKMLTGVYNFLFNLFTLPAM